MSRSPAAIRRVFTEWRAGAPEADAADMILSGILAFKTGYHNTRHNHERGINGGRKTDYSIRFGVDQLGADDAAAALDVTFRSAQAGRFGTISKYCRRLYDAMRRRDPRLFWHGEPVIREFFGQLDTDRDVEGFSMRRSNGTAGPVTSDSSHLWHMHLSFFRKFADNFDALAGIVDILLGRPIAPAPTDPGDDDMTDAQYQALLAAARDTRVYAEKAYTSLNGAVQTFERRDVARDAADAARDSATAQAIAENGRAFVEVKTALETLTTAIDQLPQKVADAVAAQLANRLPSPPEG